MKAIRSLIIPALAVGVWVIMSACEGTDSNKENGTDTSVADNKPLDTISGNSQTSSAEFIQQTVESNYTEIKLAQVAQQKSTNPEVKDLAKMLEKDHTAVLNDLKKFASERAIMIPSGEDESSRRKVEKMMDKKASDFDLAWCKELMEKHDKSIEKFEKEQTTTEDPSLKAWIAQTLPALRTHHEKLMACQSRLKS